MKKTCQTSIWENKDWEFYAFINWEKVETNRQLTSKCIENNNKALCDVFTCEKRYVLADILFNNFLTREIRKRINALLSNRIDETNA